MKPVTTASQTVGPFFHFALDRPDWADLAASGATGEKIRIEGSIRDGDGAPVFDAFLEIWQANAAGRYAHPEDRQDKPLDPRFRGFGRVFPDREGAFRFATIRPGRVPGRGNMLQAPHLNVAIFGRGLRSPRRSIPPFPPTVSISSCKAMARPRFLTSESAAASGEPRR